MNGVFLVGCKSWFQTLGYEHYEQTLKLIRGFWDQGTGGLAEFLFPGAASLVCWFTVDLVAQRIGVLMPQTRTAYQSYM